MASSAGQAAADRASIIDRQEGHMTLEMQHHFDDNSAGKRMWTAIVDSASLQSEPR